MADAERSVFEILREIAGNVRDIVRSESRLARAQIRARISAWKTGLLLIGIGCVSGVFAVFFLLLACVYALSCVMPVWAAALVVSGSMALITALVVTTGSRRLKRARSTPQ
jgi:hypothetical protein